MAPIVIDANIGLALAVNLPYSQAAEHQLTVWREQASHISVPGLWWYEVTSGLRKATHARFLSTRDALTALVDLAALGLTVVDATVETHRAALGWAERLKQVAAYDAQYIALAEKLGAELWTADKRLAQNANQSGALWVRWLGAEA